MARAADSEPMIQRAVASDSREEKVEAYQRQRHQCEADEDIRWSRDEQDDAYNGRRASANDANHPLNRAKILFVTHWFLPYISRACHARITSLR
jgi:hypothetical protein